MRILKIVLSVIALGIALIGTGQATGAVKIDPVTVDMILALGGVLGVIGVAPITLPPTTAKTLSALSVLTATAMGAHAAGKIPGPEFLFNIIGIAGTLMGIAGHSPSFAKPEAPGDKPPPPAA